MTTIPQRLREIAVRIGTHDMAAYVQLRAIANELEAPAADAVPVVAYMIETNAGVGFVTPLDGRNPCAPWLPLIRQRDHIAAIASEREHAIKLRETFLRMQQEHAGSVAALQARINELESRQAELQRLSEIGRLAVPPENTPEAANAIDAVDARHEQPAPLKYTVPYGAVNALRAALSAPQPTADERVAELMRLVGVLRRLENEASSTSGGGSAIVDAMCRANQAAAAVEASARALLSASQEDAAMLD